jgi:hypothetical protein
MKLFTTLLVLFSYAAVAQCIEGDCINGRGTYDFGYARYTGSFKDGKPHGQGVMDYGNGEKFEGNFTSGLEDGEGVLYKGGTTRKVVYRNGKIEMEVIVKGGHTPRVEGCKVGDCFNGQGEINYPSGNRYTGNFQNGQRQGVGTFIFVSGNTFTGTFEKDLPVVGAFYYAREGVTFKGTVNAECIPQTGEYIYPANEATVSIKNGTITKIVNPAADRAKAAQKQLEDAQKPVTCSRCNGKGIAGYSRVSVTNTTENVGVDRYLNGRYTTTTRYGNTSFPNICTDCGGKGVKSYK